MRSGSRTGCPGTRSTGSRASAASPPTPSTSSSKPATPDRSRPSGINLPNDQEIREKYGSKSVSLTNVNEAYDKSTSSEFRREFAWSPEEAARAEKWSSLAGELTTDLHEVIGHALREDFRAAQGEPADHAQGAVLGARRGPRGSGRAVLPARSADGGARSPERRAIRPRSSRPSTRATRGMRSCSSGACARAPRSKRTTCATGR